jgi:hypothetical protein
VGPRRGGHPNPGETKVLSSSFHEISISTGLAIVPGTIVEIHERYIAGFSEPLMTLSALRHVTNWKSKLPNQQHWSKFHYHHPKRQRKRRRAPQTRWRICPERQHIAIDVPHHVY